MRVLVTGSDGYIGHVLIPLLQAAGHDVVGLDSRLYAGCDFPGLVQAIVPTTVKDVRLVERTDLSGIDAIVHLAALSNDPLGDLDPQITYDINHRASVRLAELACDAGVARFIFSSSCSNYGVSGDAFLDESAALAPLTPYAESKVWTERDVAPLASENFIPTFLRSATCYGLSPRLRGDLVVNNLVGYAVTTGRVLIKSDGTPWRPLVHLEDVALAVKCVLEAPSESVRNETFNVGQTGENYRVREVADLVAEIVSDSKVTYDGSAGPDQRNYRVDCDKIRRVLPDFKPRWTLRQGIEQLYRAYLAAGLSEAEFLSPRYFRVGHIKAQLACGAIDARLMTRSIAT